MKNKPIFAINFFQKKKIRNFILSIIFINYMSCNQLFSIKATEINSELNCKQNPIYKNLEISTNFNENSENYDIIILKNCKISENWRVKTNEGRQHSQCVIPERVYEGEDNIRRSFRFSYKQDGKSKEKIVIKSVTLNYPKNVAETSLTKNQLILYPGESVDLYVDYDCLDMDKNRKVEENWFNLRIDLEFENSKFISFEYFKICTATYSDKLDFSHIVIIAFVFLIVYASVQDYLKSKVEVIIVEKFTEIKNPENLLIMTFVVGLVLIFLTVVDLLSEWIYIALIIVGPLSIAMIGEAILRRNSILLHLESKTYEIPYLGSITMFFLVCLGGGIFFLFLWVETQSWIINNLFSITISIITIRIFKFTSFKFMVCLYMIALTYDYYWVNTKSNYYGENYKLTNNSPINLPIHLICPQLISSPFSACSSLPIADIIFPGIFLMYSKKFDEKRYSNHYFLIGSGALALGLFLNLIVYYSKSLPLPSFLFTGPLILLSTLAFAYTRQEIFNFINGFSSTVYENKIEANLENYFKNQSKSLYTAPQIREMKVIPNQDE